MSAPDRHDLVNNAVSFLQDPKTQASPLPQRIQFLEAKGLTPPEIDTALRKAAITQPPSYYPAPTYAPYAPAPTQRWDWRDYFITGVVSGALTYTAVTLFKKYISPHLQPPTATAFVEDRDALTAQFDAAEALLKDIQAETASIRQVVQEQKEVVDKTTKDIDALVEELREGERRTREEMHDIREEINNVRDMLPKMVEKNKESHNQSLSEIQVEMRSLKALMLSRAATPAPPALPPLGRPSIPAWQLTSPVQQSDESSVDVKGKGVDLSGTS